MSAQRPMAEWGRRVSHCYLMQTPAYLRPFIITDAAVNITPDLEAKADIMRRAPGRIGHEGGQLQ